MPQPEPLSVSEETVALDDVTSFAPSHRNDAAAPASRPTVTAESGSRIIKKVREICLIQMKRIWKYLPSSARAHPAGQSYARRLHRLVQRCADRKQYFGTFFLRNRAELELMQRIVSRKHLNSSLDITVLACSKGAEVYSIAWALRSARPDLKFRINAVDISPEIVDFAAKGAYMRKGLDGAQPPEEQRARISQVAWTTSKDQNAPIFERMTNAEFEEMFAVEGDEARVRPWLKEGIKWLAGDAKDPELINKLGPQDIVVANRFLCHMQPIAAEACLVAIGGLVRPGGYLFVSGIDLDIRTQVAQRMGWNAVTELIREVHEGDTSLRQGWPLEYWGLEPISETCPDWKTRYACVYQISKSDDLSRN